MALDGGLPPAGAHGHLLVSPADRDLVIDQLTAAYAYGLITKDEFDARVTQALASRRHAELAVVIADIPAGLAAAPPPLSYSPAAHPSPADAMARSVDRAILATALISAVTFLAAFFVGNQAGGLIALGATATALTTIVLTAARAIGARRDSRSGGQPPPRIATASSSAAQRPAAPAYQPRQLPRVRRAPPTGRSQLLRPQVSS